MTRESTKSEAELKADRETRLKALKLKASVDMSTIVTEATELSEREAHRKFNQWYEAVRKGSVVLKAKKQTKLVTGNDLLKETRAHMAEVMEILGYAEEEE